MIEYPPPHNLQNYSVEEEDEIPQKVCIKRGNPTQPDPFGSKMEKNPKLSGKIPRGSGHADRVGWCGCLETGQKVKSHLKMLPGGWTKEQTALSSGSVEGALLEVKGGADV